MTNKLLFLQGAKRRKLQAKEGHTKATRSPLMLRKLAAMFLLLFAFGIGNMWGTTCTLYGGPNGNTVLGSITNGQSIPACNTDVTGWDILTSGTSTVWTHSKYSESNPTTTWPDYSYSEYSGQTLPDGITALYAVYGRACDDGYYYSGNPYECYAMELSPTSGPDGRAYRANSSGTEIYDYCFIAPGTTVYIKAEPTDADAQSCTVLDGNGDEVTVTEISTNFFSFTMPSSDVTAEVVFECPDMSEKTFSVTQLTALTSTSATVEWAIDDATKYEIWWADNETYASGTYKKHVEETRNAYIGYDDLSPNTTYWIKIRAKNDCGNTYKDRTRHFTTLQRWTISYNGNGGTVSPTSVYVDNGREVTLPLASAGTRSGYNMSGWKLNNASSGTDYALGASYENVIANATFYAQWTPISYTITYNNLNDATNSNPANYNIESANITLVNPGSRTGYTFGGWYTDAGLTVAASTPAIATGSTGNKTFYAKWTANDVAITLNANGGDANGAATVKYDGTSATITTAVTHASKSLKGYYTAATDGTKILETDGSFAASSIDEYITDGKWTRTSATELHAQWLTVERTVTFNLDGKGDNFTRSVENGTPVSKPTPDPTNADYNFVKWVTTDGGSTDFDFSQNISADVTVYSQWTAKTYQKRIFACVDISVDLEEVDAVKQKVLITSRNGVNIMGVRKLLVTVDGALSGHTVSITSDDGLKFYKLSGGKYVELTGAANVLRAPLDAQEVYVSYNPTSAGDGSITTPHFTIACDGESQEFNTRGEYVKVRNLPDAVAIVANVGGSWHGLSANITSSTTPKDQMVAVAEVGGIKMAYAPSSGFGYKLWPVRTVNSSYDRSGYTYTGGAPAKLYGDRLRFAGKDNKGLMANNNEKTNKNNINNNGAIVAIDKGFTNDENYEWKVTTREVDGQFVYTLQTDQTNNTRYLRLYNGRWGTYQDGNGTEDVYLLPLVETTLVDMQPYEWGTNQVVVSYTPAATPVALTGVNMGSDAAASPTFTQLGSSDLWRVSGLSGITGKPAQQLQVMITEDGAAKQGLLQIPLIVSGESTEAELRGSLTGANATEKNKVAKNTDVVILSTGKMTTTTASGHFKDLYIYSGGKAVITNAMWFGNIYLRGGFGYIGDPTWDVARVKIDAAVTLASEGQLYYDLTMDGTKYYDLAVPYEVDLTKATDDKGDADFNVWLKVYDGAARANTGKGWTWYNWRGDLKLHPGTGYLIEATPRYGRSYCTVRFPMTPDLSSGEAVKEAYAVTAPGMNNDGTVVTGKTPNNVGWNFLANPYMCDFGLSNNISESEVGVIQIGELVQHTNPSTGSWDGSYDWDTSEGKNVRYVTTFNYNSQEYAQHKLAEITLDPFTGFFIQAAKAGAVTFTTAGRELLLSAPAYLRAESLPSDMEIVLSASGNGQQDKTLLHINDELTLANALEFPDEMTKQVNIGKLNFYTLADITSMYANGMSYADAQEWVPAGIVVPADGVYTISASDINSLYIKNVMLLDKSNGFEYDLMSITPEFELQAGIAEDRFAVKIVLRNINETPTVLEEINEGGLGKDAEKFIYNDILYIRNNGHIYDATGKKVK